jgi:hypothetical protein
MALQPNVGPRHFQDIVFFKFSTLNILQEEDISLMPNPPTCRGKTDCLSAFTPLAK